MALLTFTVYRDKWIRGYVDSSRLLRSSDGKMCCMGFLAVSCGIEKDALRDMAVFEDLYRSSMDKLPDATRPREVGFGSFQDVYDVRKIYQLNDSVMLSEDRREQLLTASLKALDIEVLFKDTEEVRV